MGPRFGPPERGQEPSHHKRPPSTPTNPEQTDENAELPMCGICISEVRDPSVSLPSCGHAMCMTCYARACVREIGDVLHCPMCRAGSAISGTSASLQRQHGGDVVSEAMRLARSERDQISATALEASRVHGTRDVCAVCHDTLGRAASVSLSCGCHYHSRCAVGLIEDHLPNAVNNDHGIIPCP